MIDSAQGIETPEGVLLELRPAGPAVRSIAWLIDMAIRVALYMGLGMVLSFLGGVGMGIWLILMFLVEWFYPVCFEVLAKGQTVGKMALGLRVLSDDGTPVTWTQSMVRSLVMVVDFLPMLYGAGLFSMLAQRDFKRLGDLAAGTLVVYGEKRPPRHRDRRKSAEDLEGTPNRPPVPLTLEEQQALVAFAARSSQLTADRTEELADLLEPLTGQRGAQAVAHLQRLAASCEGRP